MQKRSCFWKAFDNKRVNFFSFKFTEAKFLHNCFLHNLIVYMVFRADSGNNRKKLHIVAFMPLEIAKQLLTLKT